MSPIKSNGSKSRDDNHPSYPALRISQNKHRFYLTTIPIDDLFPWCFVDPRSVNQASGFQRNLDASRADEIAEYVTNGSGSIPINIVVSAQESSSFSYNSSSKTVSFERIVEGAFLVLDGQHRLWGYHRAGERHRVPVAIYENLPRAEEAKLFIDINTKHRGVPAALLLDIKEMAQMESARESALRSIYDRLSMDRKSPLYNRTSPSGSESGKISRLTFNRAVGPALFSGSMLSSDEDTKYKIVRNYLSALDAELGEKSSDTLLRPSFLGAACEILDEVVRATVSAHGNAKQESLQQMLSPVAKLDYTVGGGRKGWLPKKAVVSLMQAAIRRGVTLNGDMV